jgi:hypothetical protein
MAWYLLDEKETIRLVKLGVFAAISAQLRKVGSASNGTTLLGMIFGPHKARSVFISIRQYDGAAIAKPMG